MASDFVDNDLLRPAPAEPAAGKAAGDALLYERLKRRVEDDESRASDELERIRKRSEEVERQRQALRALRGKQADFDRSYRELSERVKRHIVLLKGEEEQASRAATVCHETRHRFESLAEELDRIDPESWTEASLETDLTQALAQVESARAVFRKGVDRVAALGWRPDEARAPQGDDALTETGTAPRRFADWLKIGCALALPMAVVLTVLLGVYLWVTRTMAGGGTL